MTKLFSCGLFAGCQRIHCGFWMTEGSGLKFFQWLFGGYWFLPLLFLILADLAASLAFAHLDVRLVQPLGSFILDSLSTRRACTCNMVVRVAFVAFTRSGLALALTLLALQILHEGHDLTMVKVIQRRVKEFQQGLIHLGVAAIWRSLE